MNNEEFLYEYVMEELENSETKKGVWAKAIAQSEGNNDKAKSLYIQYRVEAIKDGFNSLNISYENLPKEQFINLIKNDFKNTEESEKIKIVQEEKIQEQKEIESRQQVELEKKVDEEKYGKLKGWLIFFAVLLVLWNLSQIGFAEYFKDEYITAINNMYLNGNEKMAELFSYIFYSELFAAFMLFLFTLSFFTKADITRAVGIWFFIILFIVKPFQVIGLINIYQEINEVPTSEIVKLIGSLFWAFLFLLYFIFSKRVKKTFVQKKDTFILMIFAAIIPGLLLMGYISKNGKPSSNELQNTAISKAESYFNNNDYNNANIYYDIALKKGYDPYKVADKYFDEQLYSQAIYWYKNILAKDRHNDIAKFRLGYSFNEIKDYDNAVKYYLKYLDFNNDSIAMNNLSFVYAKKRDWGNAISWAEKALKHGYNYNLFYIGYFFEMIEDYFSAEIWYLKSIEEDNEKASMWNLGLIYEFGKENVVKDIKKAMKLYQKAADLGHEKAKEKIKQNKINLTIKTYLNDVKISILNIKEPYYDGIPLTKGKYHIEVSKKGYKTYNEWVDIKDNELYVPMYKLIGNMAYKIIRSFLPWNDANNRCKAIGKEWELATIDDIMEIKKYTNEITSSSWTKDEAIYGKAYYYDFGNKSFSSTGKNDVNFPVCVNKY